MLDRRRLLLLAAAGLAAPALASTDVLEPASWWSPALGRELPYLVYPAGEPSKGAPVVYLLHGHGGNEWDWVRAGGAVDTALTLVEAGRLPPLHLVLPGAGNSWYVDGPNAAMATTLLDGLMPAVEQRLGADPARRAIIGLSMGGYGALHLGLQRPDRFRFIGALSPAIFPPGSDLSELQHLFFAGAFGEPFDPARYRAADPFGMVPRLAAAEARPAIHLACGDEDYFGLDAGTRAFGEALAAAGVPSTVRIVPGRHDWPFWRAELPLALTACGEALGAA
jgi:S-formylglutathione hydrolase FrmB